MVDFFESNGIDLEVTPIATPDDVPLFLNAGGVGLYDLAVTNNGLIEHDGNRRVAPTNPTRRDRGDYQLFPQFQRPTWSVVEEEQFAVPFSGEVWQLRLWPMRTSSRRAILLDLFAERFKGGVIMSDDVLGHFWIWSRTLDVPDPSQNDHRPAQRHN